MPYSSLATAIINSGILLCHYKLEIKTNRAGSSWAEYDFVQGSLSLDWDEDVPGEFSCELINADFAYSDESTAGTTQLAAMFRVTSMIGTEEVVEMIGDIQRVSPVDEHFEIWGTCKLHRLTKASCVITNDISPLEVEVVGDSPRRALSQIDPKFGEAYGLTSSGPGDLAFDAATGNYRRPWADLGVHVWKHATDDTFTNSSGNLETYELAQEHWRIDNFSGAITILEADPLTTYYISNLGAYEETQLGAESSTSGKNADFARLFEAAIMYPKQYKGLGVQLGEEWGCAITAVNTGTKQFTVAGNMTRFIKAGVRVYLQSSTGNDGSYSVASSTPSGGNTLIVVNETVPDATVDGYITLDTGIDMPGPFYFPKGKVSSLMQDFQQKFQKNIKPIYDAETDKFWLVTVLQKASGSTDWTLKNPTKIDQTRTLQSYYTGVRVKGKKARAENVVEKAIAEGTIVDDTTGGNPFGWNGSNVEDDDSFANLIGRVANGNATLGMNIHNLNSTPDIDGVTDDKYSGWYKMFSFPIDPSKPVQLVEAHAPGTRNEKAGLGHQGIFWPGLRLEITSDGTNWYPVTPLINGIYEPHSEISVSDDQIARAFGTHMRLLGRAYKHGFDDQADPSTGIAELRVYQDVDYTIEVSISPMHPIIARTTGALGDFTIAGDAREEFNVGDTFTVRSNSGTGDGNYTVGEVLYTGGNTKLKVTGSVDAGTTADGELYSTTDYELFDGTTIQRDYPDLVDRFDGRIITDEIDLGDRYNEALARQYAIIYLSEYIKLFQEVGYESMTDPRIRQWDTVDFDDEMNGDVDTLLVRRIQKTETKTFTWGTNYRGEVLP